MRAHSVERLMSRNTAKPPESESEYSTSLHALSGRSIFVFEELTSSFTPWVMVAMPTAALVAVWIMRWMFGMHVLHGACGQLYPRLEN